MILEDEYKQRRDSLVSKFSKNSIGVVFSATNKTRSNDTEYPFRQDSNFYYLTGFKEDNSVLVFLKKKNKTKTILFVHKKDKMQELWNGKRLGVKKAKKRFLIDEVYLVDEFEEKIKEYLSKSKNLYYDFKLDFSKVQTLLECAKDIYNYKNISKDISLMRLIKSESEISLIKKAIAITKDAHHKAMFMDKISKNERSVQAEIEYIFKKNMAYSDAYTSIVASGNSANTLHYISNDKVLKDNDLILIDAGCEYEYYASDITRTIPVSKKFTQAQKDLYNLVLDVQVKIISMIKPSVLRSDLHKKSEELLVDGMIKLKILKGKTKKLIKKQKHKKYYPHGIGHWMGLDVHDCCPYKNFKGDEIALEEGMVLTIEPAIYCDKNDKTIPKKYRGIGIRIEDDILVTKDGYENLSCDIFKSIKDIEK
ncbi:MAG: aminopeptidase P N-terminal domain-containing protein [Campylobacterota bacterium]|nr:aminopeptidase P N-terminal domain-containing protein [Campylobacterota bacterium]